MSENIETKETEKKSKEKIIPVIAGIILAVIIGVVALLVLSKPAKPDDLSELYGLNRSEIDKMCGDPEYHNGGEIQVGLRYSDNFVVSYLNKEDEQVFLSIGAAEYIGINSIPLLGITVGDEAEIAFEEAEKRGFKLVKEGEKNSDSKAAYVYEDDNGRKFRIYTRDGKVYDMSLKTK